MPKQVVAGSGESGTIDAPRSGDRRVLRALRSVPRNPFLPEGEAFSSEGMHVLTRMLEALELRGTESVLDIGTGSGYRAAVLGTLAGFVRTIELRPDKAERARCRLGTLGVGNVDVIEGDGSLGWHQGAPYHAILVGASVPSLPRELVDQLHHDGRLVIAIGDGSAQLVGCFRRRSQALESRTIAACALPPLVGRCLERPSLPWVRSTQP